MRNVKYSTILLFLIVKSSIQVPLLPLQAEPQELFVTENIRAKRQAGYVYDKPTVSFDLPMRASTVSIQAPTATAPTVDRTQAQMMYYAYPAPAAAGNAGNIGGSSGSASSSATASSGTAAAGSNYGAQTIASTGAQSMSAAGYSQIVTGSIQSLNAGSSGYGYNAPTSGAASLSNSFQTSNAGIAGSSQTALSSSSSGYAYNAPTNTQSGSGVTDTIDVSTNAPKYLPPISGGGNSNNVESVSISSGTGTISVSGSVAGAPPLDQYLPPISQTSSLPSTSKYLPPTSGGVSTSSVASAPRLDQYLPPISQTSSLPSLNSSGPSSVNIGVQTGTGSGPSSNYIPPNRASPAPPATPRPFSASPTPPASGYLSPNQNSPSTPAATYLPPIL